ncbi:MAG TPA: hypothetical protein P5040_02620 [Smithella sp.]|nr:hypothetical protein [Smithella sp.]
MQSYAAKLIDLIESKSENIARQWADDVMKHPRTPSFHSLAKAMVIEQGVDFYKLFRRMSMAENPYEEAKTFSWRYAEKIYDQNIPLREALYALMLMRRNLWLYAEFQGLFFTALEKQQAVESLNRTILLFDYVSYQVAEKYEELMHERVNKIFSSAQIFMQRSCFGQGKNLFQFALIGGLVLLAFVLTYYCHAVGQTGVVFTHLFYIPIVLAAICWGRKGMIVPIILGLMLLCSHAVFLKGISFTEDIIRALMFLAVSFVVGWLMEDIRKVWQLFDS